jgi:nucleotide-binding universal stress UspA family protein
MTHQRILVIVDPEQAQHPSLERAAGLARPTNALIELYTCGWSDGPPARWVGSLTQQQYRALLREERQQWLEQLAQPLRSSGLRVEAHTDWHPNVEQALLQYIVVTKPSAVLDEELHSLRERLPQYGGQGPVTVT